VRFREIARAAARWPFRAAAVVVIAFSMPTPKHADISAAVSDEGEPVSVWVDFSTGSSEPSPSSLQELAALVPAVRKGSSLVVIGHAGERADLNDNLDLAERRARRVASYLVSLGIMSERIVVAGAESTAELKHPSRCEVRLVVRAREG
jgi:outer membrane protein OmpA-like peptidoglycan-associated protein